MQPVPVAVVKVSQFKITMQTFELKDRVHSLKSALKALGWAETGGHAHELIDSGYVSVDGDVETQRRKKIRTGMLVNCEDQEVKIVSVEV
jgi:ribosome-associated protein